MFLLACVILFTGGEEVCLQGGSALRGVCNKGDLHPGSLPQGGLHTGGLHTGSLLVGGLGRPTPTPAPRPPLQDTWDTARYGHQAGDTTSYWNAFLLSIIHPANLCRFEFPENSNVCQCGFEAKLFYSLSNRS